MPGTQFKLKKFLKPLQLPPYLYVTELDLFYLYKLGAINNFIGMTPDVGF